MVSRSRREIYAQLENLPEHEVGEIIDGELIVSPRPASRHSRAETAIGGDLFGRFDGPPDGPERPGGWWILNEPELHLGDDVLVPDVAGWKRERMPVFPHVAAFTQPPDWVCEILSPSTALLDRSRKLVIYAREGVGHLWFVDPLLRTLEIYRLRDGHWVVDATHGGDAAVRAAPFDAVELAMARWWA